MAPAQSLTTKLKVQLKLAIARLRMVQQRDEQLGKTARRQMAQLLEAGKVDSATIRVENIIRGDIQTELHEMLELYCELLLARAGLLEGPSGAACDPGLEEAVHSLVYAAGRTDVKELATVRGLLAERFGKEFVVRAMEDADGKVSRRVVRKLGVEPPRAELVQGYLEEIAKAYGVNWPGREAVSPPPPLEEEGEGEEEESKGGTGRGGGAADDHGKDEQGDRKVAAGTPRKKAMPDLGPTSPVTVTPPRMTTDNVHPKVTLGSVELKPNKKMEGAAAAASSSAASASPPAPPTQSRKQGREPEGSVPDISDLEARFAALKRK